VKIEFKLNFAEFLEAHEGSRGKAGRALTSTVTASWILIASGLLAVGLWTGFKQTPNWLARAQARYMSGGFAAAGVLLLMGLPYLWQWRRDKDRQLGEEKLRYDFELIKDDVNEFEADEQGWSYRSQRGRDVRPWETLLGLWEQDTILMLASNENVYLLPKRAFTDEQRAELSNFVDSVFQRGTANSLFAAQLRPSAWDYTLASAHHSRIAYTPAGMVLFGVGIAGLVALWVTQLHWWDADEIKTHLILSTGLLLLILWFFIAPLVNLKRYQRNVKREPLIEATITPDTIFLRASMSRYLLKYERLSKYKETKQVFLLFYDDDRYVMLSKRARFKTAPNSPGSAASKGRQLSL
jgi:YcxB-like protein